MRSILMHTYYKKLLTYMLFFGSMFTSFVFAHPIDISTTNITISGPHINWSVILHSYEAQWLLTQKGKEFVWIESYFEYRDVLEQYVKESLEFKLTDTQETCPIENVSIIEKDTPSIVWQWLDFTFFARCSRQVDRLFMSVKFFPEFPLQTNRVTLYAWPGLQTTPHTYKIFTTKVTDADIDLTSAWESCTDTDGDGMCDDDEKAFGTDEDNWDTDSDCYSDFEEIYNSWAPKSKDLSPWQTIREWCQWPGILASAWKIPTTDMQKDTNISFDSYIQWWWAQFAVGYLTLVLQKIYDYSQNQSAPLWQIVLLVILLGFIHAIGPWHSKHLMSSYLLDGEKWYWHGFLYPFFFALTHVSDLFILFFWVYIFTLFSDPTPYMPYIQFFATLFLLGYSARMLWKAWKNYQQKKQESCEHVPASAWTSVWQTFWISFVSWLAPCTFWWSIFLLLFSLGRMDLIIPMLLSLSLGIYICLQLIALIVVYSRKTILSRFENWSRWSGMISFSLLFVISLSLVWKMFMALFW